MTGETRRVDLGWSVVESVVDGPLVRALGIPYAHADRGGAPVPAQDPSAQRSVACPQPVDALSEDLLGFDPLGGLPQDEDCLRLSVTAPADAAAGEALPVLVWVHGGGYRTGAGDAPVHDPTALVAEGRVVHVAITYRLGAFGFLRSSRGQDANLGLLDVMEALRWVHANVAAFGGDPDAVTLYGQSSGADLVVKALSLDETADLVARVVLQSAPLGLASRPAALDRALDAVADEVLERVDAGDLDGGYALVDVAARPFGLAAGMPFSARYGQLPLRPEAEAVRATLANASRLDVLIGYTAEETRFFLPALRAADSRLRVPVLGALLGRLVVRVTSERVYGRANRGFARALARGGARVTTYVLSANRGRAPFGAGHTVDLGLLFPSEGQSERERRDGAALRGAWLEFARTGGVSRGVVHRRTLRTRELRRPRGSAGPVAQEGRATPVS